MNSAIDWMKSNPITVASIIVVIVSLGVVGWGFRLQATTRAADQERVSRAYQDINRYINQTVRIPPERPDADSEQVRNVTITEEAWQELERLYGQINEQYQQVFNHAVEFNRGNHQRLVPALFTERAGPNTPIEARQAYRAAFDRMFRPASPDDPDAPRLNAGRPPSQEWIDSRLQQLEDQIRAEFIVPGQRQSNLTDRQLEQLHEEKRLTLQQILRDRASQIHIYAEPDIRNNEFPFHVGDWALRGDRPEPHQLWEGQLELWIQQDIVRAIGIANRVHDPDYSVIEAPVKRLLSIEVVPGYVGLHTLGGVAGSSTGLTGGRTTGRTTTGANRLADGSYAMPINGQRTHELTGEMPINFHVGPTGRVSNAMYDVRHVRLHAIVDDQQLPELFRALSQVNFMTVLKVAFRDVDEFEALKQGYVYGTGNAVEAEMVIETIWLREWTEPMMPELVRQYVGIDPPPATERGGMQDWDMEFDFMW